MDRLISLQAAIDAAIEAVDEWDGGYNLTRADMIADAINNALPSAQPAYTDEQIQKMQDLEQAELDKAFELGKQAAQPEPHEIGYSECANSMLKMWIDNVLTDGEYSHIMDKLNAYWAERRTDESD